MKKTIATIMMLLAVITAGAQDGVWKTDTIKGDELKGTKDDVAHAFEQEDMGMFIFWENCEDRFAIVSPNAMFETTVSNGDTGALSIIGIYDNGDNMKEKLNVWLILEKRSQHKRLFAIALYNNPLIKNHKKNIKKILDAVKSGDGYIRILAGRYNAPDFDLKVTPCN